MTTETEEKKAETPEQGQLPLEEEKIQVEVVDDTPPEDKSSKKPVKKGADEDDELLSYSESVQKRINKLKRDQHDERRAREAAERRESEAVALARSLLEKNKELESKMHVDRGALLNNAEVRIESQLSIAKQALKEAFAASDFEKVAEANEQIARLAVEKEQVKRLKGAAPQQQKSPQQNATTPLHNEESAVQQRVTEPAAPKPDPKAVEWAGKNPWFGRDPVMTGFTYGLHQKLVSSGVDPRTDDYWTQLEKAVREKFPEEFADDADTADDSGEQTPPPKVVAKTTARPSTVVAPATRTSGGAKKVVLKESQVALARRLGVSPEEYARHVALLEKGAQ